MGSDLFARHETSYPPPWGSASLDVAEFEDVLGPIVVREYLYQAQLYAVPPKLRRYCKQFQERDEMFQRADILM